MSENSDFETTVLGADYSDFHDTVVDQVIPFDPNAMQARTQPMQPAQPAQSAQPMQPAQSAPVASASGQGSAYTHSPTASEAQPVQPASSPSSATPSTAGGFRQKVTSRLSSEKTESTPVQPAVSTASSWQSVPRVSPSFMPTADSYLRSTNRVLIGVVVALSIVAVVAIVVAVAFAVAPQEKAGTMQVVAASTSSAPRSAGSASTEMAQTDSKGSETPEEEDSAYKEGLGSSTIVTSGDGRALSEQEAYESLLDFYEQAGDFDIKIASCADDFNANYAKEDESLRKAKASTASALKSNIKSAWNDVKDIDMPFMSKNAMAYEDICTLYECLWHRIEVIDRAWTISLSFEKPAEHEAEILAPIKADQVGGQNKYQQRFKELYSKVHLVKP